MKFLDNIKISQSVYGKDKLHFMIFPNNLIVDAAHDQPIDESSIEESFMIKLLPMPKSIKLAEEAVEHIENA